MTLQECISEINTLSHYVGKPIKKGYPVKYLIPAPYPANTNTLIAWITIAQRNNWDWSIIELVVKFQDYQVLILVDNPIGGLAHSWFLEEFPKEEEI